MGARVSYANVDVEVGNVRQQTEMRITRTPRGTMYNLVPKVELKRWKRSATTVTAPCDCHHTHESAPVSLVANSSGNGDWTLAEDLIVADDRIRDWSVQVPLRPHQHFVTFQNARGPIQAYILHVP